MIGSSFTNATVSSESALPERAGDETVLEIARARRDPRFYIVDQNLKVVGAPIETASAANLHMPPDVAALVSRLLRAENEAGGSTVALLRDDLIVRVVPLNGADPRYAVFLEQYESRDLLRASERTYNLTPRETELLELLLRGEATSEMAAALCISEFTVQQHVKNIGSKLGITKRKEIVATILGMR